MRTHPVELKDLTRRRSPETLAPNWAESNTLADTDDQDYLLDLEWNSGRDEVPSKGPDNERSFQENTTLLEQSPSLLALSDRAEGAHATSDLFVGLDLDSDTEIMDGLENQLYRVPDAYINSPLYGRPPVSCSSPGIHSPTTCVGIQYDEYEAAMSGSRDIPWADTPIELGFGRCSSANVTFASADLVPPATEILDFGNVSDSGKAPAPDPVSHGSSRGTNGLSAACIRDDQVSHYNTKSPG